MVGRTALDLPASYAAGRVIDAFDDGAAGRRLLARSGLALLVAAHRKAAGQGMGRLVPSEADHET